MDPVTAITESGSASASDALTLGALKLEAVLAPGETTPTEGGSPKVALLDQNPSDADKQVATILEATTKGKPDDEKVADVVVSLPLSDSHAEIFTPVGSSEPGVASPVNEEPVVIESPPVIIPVAEPVVKEVAPAASEPIGEPASSSEIVSVSLKADPPVQIEGVQSQPPKDDASAPEGVQQEGIPSLPVALPVAAVPVAVASEPVFPPAAVAPAPEPAKKSSGWGWFGWGKKTEPVVATESKPADPATVAAVPSSPSVSPAAAAASSSSPAKPSSEPSSAERRAAQQHRESLRLLEVADAKIRAQQDQAFAEAARRREAEERQKDHLGGTTNPFWHSLARYSINKFFGFEEWEEGMEERYRVVLCREMVTMQTEMVIPEELQGDEELVKELPPLLLEMSHFYPKGCHNTPLPVILVRTPYDRALMRHTAERICQHGYHVIVQDTRNSPNAAALRVKAALAKAAQVKARKLVDQEAEAIRKRYQAKSPKPAESLSRQVSESSAPMDPLSLEGLSASGAIASAPISSNNSPSLSHTALQQQVSSTASAAQSSASSSPAMSPSTPQRQSSNDQQPASSILPPLTSNPQEFFPIVHEAQDGYATIDWISKQAWCDGNVSFYGASYLGIAQYAVVDKKHPALKCIVPVASASRVFNIMFPQPGTLNLDLAARWLFIMFSPSVTGATPGLDELGGDESNGGIITPPSFWKRSYARVIGSRSIIPKAVQHLPACELDEIVTSKKLSFYKEMIQHGSDENSLFWKEKQVQLCHLENAPPLLIVEGWYDLFLQQALRDYLEALEIYKAFQLEIVEGKYTEEELSKMQPSIKTFKPYLTILSCRHIDFKQLYRISLQESIQWFDFHMKPSSTKSSRMIDRPSERSVRVQMINAAGPNEQRHQALIQKRKKAEQARIAAATSPAASNSSSANPMDPTLIDLMSPRSKSRYRQQLLDAEWRFFPEFPPPQARSVKWYLYCDVHPDGREERLLRLEPHGAREKAVKRHDEARLAAMVAVISRPHEEQLVEHQVSSAAYIPGASSSSTHDAAARAVSASLQTTRKLPTNLQIAVPAPVVPAPISDPLPQLSFSTYSYDPRDPTPSIGGTAFDVENSGPMDCRPMEGRSDVLVFTSEPLTTPLVCVGFVHCMLYIRSNVPCTDFVARLCDVYPADEWSSSSDRKSGSGKSQILCDGLFKVTPAKIDELTVEKPVQIPAPTRPKRTISLDKPVDFVKTHIRPAAIVGGAANDLVLVHIIPEVIVDATDFAHPFFPITAPDNSTPLLKLDIDMWATGNVFQVGHRIRFHICSAAHPRWLRSLGGADPMFAGLDQAQTQHQTVYHEANYPSALVLPVLNE